VLFVTDLTVHYGKVAALRRVSLRVLDGEVVGLIGPNGAGKTTLAHAVAGLVRPTSGRIAFNGTALTRSRPDRIARLGISLVPEGRHVFSSLTVKENLLLGATPVRRRRSIAADVDEVLDLFPALRGFYGASAATLSGGEQQQLAIARALLARPQLLILDEPSLGLAPLIVDQIFTTLARLRSEGCTVLLIEQQALRTVRFADRAYVLRSGELVSVGEADDLPADVALAEVYLGRR
jgi:branched-chain amino acid transport system ATP-binding protein